MGEAAQPRPRRGVLCKSCRKGRPNEQGEWNSVGQRRKLRTVSYSFPGTEGAGLIEMKTRIQED